MGTFDDTTSAGADGTLHAVGVYDLQEDDVKSRSTTPGADAYRHTKVLAGVRSAVQTDVKLPGVEGMAQEVHYPIQHQELYSAVPSPAAPKQGH